MTTTLDQTELRSGQLLYLPDGAVIGYRERFLDDPLALKVTFTVAATASGTWKSLDVVNATPDPGGRSAGLQQLEFRPRGSRRGPYDDHTAWLFANGRQVEPPPSGPDEARMLIRNACVSALLGGMTEAALRSCELRFYRTGPLGFRTCAAVLHDLTSKRGLELMFTWISP
ncbi:hypothetical protein [Deinococcus pimensis]|uniref:hypothetical protein n=1 Tax=Deinococcus pimensis TaxID=309888 RepID=UPI0004871913|nr:hypothetical protein [Deinococcus pimensis]